MIHKHVDSIEFLMSDGKKDKNDLLNETVFDRTIQLAGYTNKARYPH